MFQDGKCLRLLKKFDHNRLLSKRIVSTYDDFDFDHSLKLGKRGQVTDQFLELPMEHRIYDMVEDEGPKGITIREVIYQYQHCGFAVLFKAWFLGVLF